ncbi:SIR2 family protein [Pseudomonas sp. Larv2_ips]|uniref:SIR2 family NAD-dependent protein deacylase n=1 Tax=Pseudomonas sp. Larv2_ips TaxID=1896942 RepID=UPI000E6BFDF3|nr:SIR2 family protein [Pseudomonas sp. Larv2_ips]
MSTNDQLHILQLQKDLWRWPRSRSAVMVGAGFSLNSQPLPGVASRFPTWSELVKKMFDELYPIEANASEDDKNYRTQRFLSENYLRLASKYEAAFGYARLDTLIRKMNPDDDHIPGLLHRKLLALPWNDIFTTNYDTLLERTEDLGRSYQTIASFAELPGSLSPRIFKLHGSFASTGRLVIAEEHYRKYPKDSAPFVNTVQQSLLENSFVLLGFSGDDPNFLAWTGWIRDELQDRHSSIYLVGPLNLSNTDRLLLSRRGVTPIDLCPMFRRDEHYESILWFLESLAEAAPQRPENWLELEPKVKVISAKPLSLSEKKSGPPLPQKNHTSESISEEQLKALMQAWAYERLSYPGWVTAPKQKRDRLWNGTVSWLTELVKILPSLSAVDKLLCVQELVWRFNLCLMPLFQDFIAIFDADLVKIYENIKSDSFKSERLESEIFGKISPQRLINSWLDVSLDVMREAREVYDDVRWKKLSSMISEVLEANQITSDRFIYEKLLNSAWNVRLDEDLEDLIAWQPREGVPQAQLWKASLLAEAGEVQESKVLLEVTLNGIRKSSKNKGDNIELMSLEGWCTYLICCLNRSFHYFDSSEFGQRWQELKAWDCNPWEIQKELENSLAEMSVHPSPTGKVRKAGFDPRVVHHSIRFSGGVAGTARPAFSYLRHFEHVGVPMYCHGINFVGGYLEKAVQIIQPYISFWSPALMIRSRQIKELSENPAFLGRTQVASLDVALARRINAWCLTIFERHTKKYYISRHQEIFEDRLVSGLPEVLSRVSFKLSSDELDHNFRLALKIYSTLANISAPAINSVCHKWLTRIYDAADDNQLMGWLPDLLKAPFREFEGSKSRDRFGWVDPMSQLPVQRLQIKDRGISSSELDESISWLFRKIYSLDGDARSSAIWRLTMLNSAALLDSEHIKKLRELLWINVEKYALPVDLHPFNYLHLPKRNERTFLELFKKNLLNQPLLSSLREEGGRFVLSSQGEFPSERLNNIVMSSKPPVQLINEANGLVVWSEDEVFELFEELVSWWDTVKEESLRFDEVRFDGARCFGNFVLRVIGTSNFVLPREFLLRVYRWILDVRNYNICADTALSAFYFILPEKEDEIKELLQSDLNSGEEIRIKCAIRGVHNLYALAQSLEKKIDNKLLMQLIYRIVFRSERALLDAVERVSFLIMQFPSVFQEREIELLAESLAVWAETISLPVHIEVVGIEEVSRPDLQAAVGTLAGTMSAWSSKNKGVFKRHPGIDLWKEICDGSCLPEVKRSFRLGVQYSMKKNQ